MAKKAATTKNTKPEVKTKEVKAKSDLIAPMYLLTGEKGGDLKLPEMLFGGKIVKPLLSQAIRVYLNNQTGHFSNTKTRAQVQGSTRKIYRQKGTGRARHGSLRAPIFVGGGIALGPKSRKINLSLPLKMKKAALVCALSLKQKENLVVGVEGLEKVNGKTTALGELFKKLDSRNILLVSEGSNPNLERSVKNMSGMDLILVDQLNVYEVIKHQMLAITKEAISKLEIRVAKKQPKAETGEGEVAAATA